MGWGTIAAGGKNYNLDHLDTKVILVTPKAAGARTYRVLVSYGHHTFTRALETSDRRDMEFCHRGDIRCFCPIRYGLTVELPGIVESAKRAYWTHVSKGDRNYLIAESVGGFVEPYAVYFNMERATAKNVDVAMFVVSAYPKPGLPALSRLDRISFATLVATIAGGKTPKRPPPKS